MTGRLLLAMLVTWGFAAAAPAGAPVAAPAEALVPPPAGAPAAAPADTPASPSAKAPAPNRAGAPDTSWDRYRMLSERNIFSRNRSAAPAASPALSRPPEVPQNQFVLTGVLQVGGEGIAFFEDARTRATVKVSAGHALGAGKVTAVTPTGVEYELDGATRTVAIGENLTRAPAALPADAATKATGLESAPASSQGNTAASPAAPGTNSAPPAGARPAGAAVGAAAIPERMR